MTALIPDHYVYLNPTEANTFKMLNQIGSEIGHYPLYILRPQTDGTYLLHVNDLSLIQNMLVDRHIRKLVSNDPRTEFVINCLIRKMCTNAEIIDIRKKF